MMEHSRSRALPKAFFSRYPQQSRTETHYGQVSNGPGTRGTG